MAKTSLTKELGLPLILGSDIVLKEKINATFQKIDAVVLPKTHADTKAHFDMWQPNQDYKKQDVVRTSTCPSWGFFMCTTPGTSGTMEPTGYGEGDIVPDGTCTWILKLFGGETAIKHQDLKGRNLPDQHTIEAITDLQLELDTLHNEATHANKSQLDKISEDANGLMLYNKKSLLGGAELWTANTYYAVSQLVIYSKILYRCTTAHTSSFFLADINNWTVVHSNIRDWATTTYYGVSDVVFVAATLYKCTTAHTSGASFDAAEKSYWVVGGTAVGISSMAYDSPSSKFIVGLSDGSSSTFSGIGQNFYEGYSKTDLLTAPIAATGAYDLPADITSQDFVNITAGVQEGYYKSQNIKVSDITFTKTIGSMRLQTSLGSTGTTISGGTYTKTIDMDLYLKVTTAPKVAGDVAGMVVSTGSTVDGTYTAQAAFSSGNSGVITINGVTATFILASGQTFAVGEMYSISICVDSSTSFLVDGKSGENWYAIKMHFKGSKKLSIDEILSNGWTIPQIVNACGYKGQANNVTAVKSKLLYSGSVQQYQNPNGGGSRAYTMSDSLLNYDYIMLCFELGNYTVQRFVKVSGSDFTTGRYISLSVFNTTNYYADAYYYYGGANTLYVVFFNGGSYSNNITLLSVYGLVSGDGKVTLSSAQDSSGKYSLTLTNIDGTSTITLPYVSLLSGNVFEMNDDGILRITHSDGSQVRAKAGIEKINLWSGTANTNGTSLPLTEAWTNFSMIMCDFKGYYSPSGAWNFPTAGIECSRNSPMTVEATWYADTSDYYTVAIGFDPASPNTALFAAKWVSPNTNNARVENIWGIR